jgi:hypothetical protein
MAVELETLWAHRVGRTVVIGWRTVSEVDNAGFFVWRAAGVGKPVRLTPRLLPARGSPLRGHTYRFHDTGAPRQRTRYWIEDVDLSGVSTLHGPVSAAAWRPKARPSLPLLSLPSGRALEVPS